MCLSTSGPVLLSASLVSLSVLSLLGSMSVCLAWLSRTPGTIAGQAASEGLVEVPAAVLNESGELGGGKGGPAAPKLGGQAGGQGQVRGRQLLGASLV